MVVLWITNVELPTVAIKHGKEIYVGGWMDQSSKLLANNRDVELHILSAGEEYEEIEIDGIFYSGFKEKKIKKSLSGLLCRVNPEVIHIWGTEYLHAYDAINLLEKKGKKDKVVVSIQGLVSIYINHYFAGLPHKVVIGRTIYETARKNALIDLYKTMCKQGMREKYILSMAQYCIGRTDWDLACVKQINSEIKYFFCNEILRRFFYDYKWSYDKCEKYVIAFSQTHYPIKGLHYMLEALYLIKKKYSEVKLRVLGNSPYRSRRFKVSTYQRYIMKLIDRYQLYDNIEWVGNYNEKQMVHHYLRANVFVCASTIENSSNSIGEAMLLGLPVVASDVGGIKSLLQHNIDGLIYQADAPYMLADCVLKIFDDCKFAKSMGDNARKRALQIHNRENNTDDLLNIYNTIRGGL